jgi:hypothetical protein
MLLVVLDELELHRAMLSPSPSLRKKGTPSRALLHSPPPPKIPLGEFAIPRRPYREKLIVAPGPPRAAVSQPRLDRRPRLNRRYPFVLIKSEPFNQSSMAQVRY